MDSGDIVKTLTPLERKILPLLKQKSDIKTIAKNSNLSDTEINRALSWLQNKNLAKINEETKESIILGKNGEEYLRDGLPERRVLHALKENSLSQNNIREKACLNEDELRISLGILKKRDAIDIKDKIIITENGKR